MEFKSVIDNIDEDLNINKFFDDVSDSESEEEYNNSEDCDDTIIGIDLGTTNSAVSVIRNNNYEIITDDYGNRTIPSIVSFTKLSKYVGHDAKNQIELNPENSYYEVKRLIGKKYNDQTVKNDIPFFTYEIEGDIKNNIFLKSNLLKDKKLISPEEISSHILRKLRDIAEEYLKKKIKRAVITVPAYFNDSQREATKDAARIAGINCVRIINEPTAAALMYGLHHRTIDNNDETIVLVYDLGGGTLDCSILRISDGVFEVLASTGNTHLGGADFDKALMKYCKLWFKKKYNISKLDKIPLVNLQKLRSACERAKKLLSTKENTIIAVKNFYDGKNIFIKLTRDMFYKICKDLFILCLKPVEDVINSANVQIDDIDEIILVGGATRTKQIKDNLKTYFKGKEPNISVDPDEVVAAGAAIQGHIIEKADDPFSNSVVLLDILPMSLGIETIGGEMTTIVPRNTRIPCRKTKKFTTDDDDQTSVTIKVFEGERKLTCDNFEIAQFDLEGLEPEPRGIANIDVTFAIDVNGIINVTAVDKRNDNNKKSMTVKCNKDRLTAKEIDRLVKEANENDIKDKYNCAIKRYRHEIKNLCDNILTNLKNDEFKLKDSDKKMVNEDINKVLEWLNNIKEEKKIKNNLEKVYNRLKKRYGTLILKLNNNEDNVKAEKNTDVVSTSVYGNENDIEDEVDDESKIFEEIKNDEFGFDHKDNDETKKKIKELRLILTDTCTSFIDILFSESLNINEDEVERLKDIIDDAMLWLHVKQKITIEEYEDKIDEINKLCNNLVENNNDLFKKEESNKTFSKKEELEQLCYAIKTNISSNNFSIEDKLIKKLENKLNKTLDWIIDIDINNNENIENSVYEHKIKDINDMCDKLYNNMTESKLNFNNNIISEDDNKDNNKEDTNTSGKSIAELIKKN